MFNNFDWIDWVIIELEHGKSSKPYCSIYHFFFIAVWDHEGLFELIAYEIGLVKVEQIRLLLVHDAGGSIETQKSLISQQKNIIRILLYGDMVARRPSYIDNLSEFWHPLFGVVNIDPLSLAEHCDRQITWHRHNLDHCTVHRDRVCGFKIYFWRWIVPIVEIRVTISNYLELRVAYMHQTLVGVQWKISKIYFVIDFLSGRDPVCVPFQFIHKNQFVSLINEKKYPVLRNFHGMSGSFSVSPIFQ